MKNYYGGIVNFDEYKKSSPKIMVLLKEENDKNNGSIINYVREIVEKRALNTTWKNVEKILSIIFNDTEKDEYYLKKIAVSNINKCEHSNPSDSGKTITKTLEKILKNKDNKLKEAFIEEVNKYKPDIIICGNVHHYIRSEDYFHINFEEIETKKSDDKQEMFYINCRSDNKQILVIGLYHPSSSSNYQNKIFKFIKENFEIIKNFNNSLSI